MQPRVAVIGSGIIGVAWSLIFSRAGHPVRIYDKLESQLEIARETLDKRVNDLVRLGELNGKDVLELISYHNVLSKAVDGVVYVQECISESLPLKQSMFESLDAMCEPQVILASSSPSLKASLFTEALQGRSRCIICHAASPPFPLPVVEVVPSPWTDQAVISEVKLLINSVGLRPVILKRETDGFLVNRLKDVLLAEAYGLVEAGVAEPDDIDALRRGIALKWSFIGPFQTISLSSPVKGYEGIHKDKRPGITTREQQWKTVVGPQRIAIIPARGGSKRIPRKNVKLFAGKPMICYSIEAARRSRCFSRIIVSTDDEEIARVARGCDAEVPWLRPAELADDFTTTVEVIEHALNNLDISKVDAVCCIYATAPFITPDYLRQGLFQLQRDVGCCYVFPVAEFPAAVQRALVITPQGRTIPLQPENVATRTQDLEPAFYDVGQFYWGTPDAYLKKKPMHGPNSSALVIVRERAIDIDTPEDWRLAEIQFRVLNLTLGQPENSDALTLGQPENSEACRLGEFDG